MKKLCLGNIAMILLMASCAGAPKDSGTTVPAQEAIPVETAVQPEPVETPERNPEPEAESSLPEAEEEAAVTAMADAPVSDDPSTEVLVDAFVEGVNDSLVNVVIDAPALDAEETIEIELIEPEMAEAVIEQRPPAEDIDPANFLSALPDPETPEFASVPPPVVPPAPPPEPVPQSSPVPPPVEQAVVEPEPAAEPEPAEPPPELAEEPPPVEREPIPRVIPELPRPTPGIVMPGIDEKMNFSRVVRAVVGQLVEIPFRGTGWVYLGEAAALRGIAYDSRRLDPEGQSFIFKTEAAGSYALKFYRQDFVRDFILNDNVQVIVSDLSEAANDGSSIALTDRGRVIAEPRWPTSLDEAQASRADGNPPARKAQAAEPESSPPLSTPSVPPPASIPADPSEAVQTPALTETDPPPETPLLIPDEYIAKAREEYEAGRIDAAISLLDQFREHYPAGSDELLWLYGQFYEANSPSRNILAALDSYRRLTREFPQSSRAGDARRRIAYLERYYINIH